MGWKRIIPSLVILCSGAGMLVYGAMFRTVVVFREEETEHSIPVPSPFFPQFSQFEQELFSEDVGGESDLAFERNPFETGAPSEGSLAVESVNPFEQQRSPQEEVERNPFASPEDESNDVRAEPDVEWETPQGVVFESIVQIEWIAHHEPEWAVVREVTVGGVARLESGGLTWTYHGERPLLCLT